MAVGGHKVIGVIEIGGRNAPADLRPPRRRRASKQAVVVAKARRQPETLECEMIPADLRQLRRDLRHELARLLARIAAANA
jgi:hypothetical protein